MKITNNELVNVYNSDISADGKFVVPDSVTEIEDFAFWGCDSLKEVIIPSGVTKIGDFAFEDCSSLEEIVLPDSLTQMGDYVFKDCSSLKKIVIPEGVTQIGHSAFFGCNSLEEFVIPSSVTEIGSFAFWGCSSLKEIKIPDNVTEIGEYAFCRCSSLKEIQIPDSVIKMGEYAFNICESLSTIHWENKTYSVRCIDGFCMQLLKEKQWENYNIVKCTFFPNGSDKIVYAAEKDGFAAHGTTIREAVSDLQFKLMEEVDISEHITRIAQQGYMDANDYRLLTGACRQGTDHFLREHNLTWEDTMPVEEVLELTKGFYGFESFKKAAEKILSIEN